MQGELPATTTTEDSEPMETAEREVSKMAQSMQNLRLASTNVDEGDSDNPFMCTEYVKDIYKYLKELEASLIRIHITRMSCVTFLCMSI